MSNTVWVVEQGEYSDYRVVGVFSSEANATLVSEATGSYARVSEWPVDPAVDELNQGQKRFVVHMLRDGTVESCTPYDFDGSSIAAYFHIWRRSTAPINRGKAVLVPDVLIAEVWAADADHAVKIANEKRGQMIATGAWWPTHEK